MSTETYRDHVEQQEKHIKDHIGDEIRKVKEREERETHGFHDAIGDEIAMRKRPSAASKTKPMPPSPKPPTPSCAENRRFPKKLLAPRTKSGIINFALLAKLK